MLTFNIIGKTNKLFESFDLLYERQESLPCGQFLLQIKQELSNKDPKMTAPGIVPKVLMIIH